MIPKFLSLDLIPVDGGMYLYRYYPVPCLDDLSGPLGYLHGTMHRKTC